ncbi:hypothetical protein NPIL_91671 [Nephila pilipes]|uniref:Uncharacterized protein n=1 Tax=Nephila pilipes TaxID=299642 RepID=A0A8X6NVA6_NEPPI|nr:hypothetical protein NPIL_91671 [Nephila pilipes]
MLVVYRKSHYDPDASGKQRFLWIRYVMFWLRSVYSLLETVAWWVAITNLKDAARKGQPQKLDDDVLEATVDSDPRQTIVELSVKIGCPWCTV